MRSIEKWDERFLEMAKLVSTWSKDPSTQTGAVIVRNDRTVVSVGFNGFPKNMSDSPDLYADREQKYSRIIHCEMNALLHANEKVEGMTLYTYPFASCDRCAVHMLQAGIDRFVFPALAEDKKERWAEPLAKTKKYFEEAGVEYIEF
jgi:dCMP deaminase